MKLIGFGKENRVLLALVLIAFSSSSLSLPDPPPPPPTLPTQAPLLHFLRPPSPTPASDPNRRHCSPNVIAISTVSKSPSLLVVVARQTVGGGGLVFLVNDSKNQSVQWVFLGSPRVEKGTYASRLSNLLGVPHIATRDLVREELVASGPLSHQLSEIVNQGKLVSDEIIINLLSKRLEAKWTSNEDEKLIEAVALHGSKNWNSISSKAGLNRSGKSCWLRWVNHLRPNIKRGDMSEQEEDLIIRLHKLLGNR
ncbi:hypothetical protein ACLB2K_061821 [Fragaria x ananassa]